MKLPFFSSFIIFIFVLTHQIRKQRSSQERKTKAFWDREQRANNVRKKSLDNLDYIRIPLDQLPMDTLTDQETVAECIDTVKRLANEKIVNFTGLTNTDLKLEYGTANLPILSEYDQCYTTLVCTLQRWADALLEQGFDDDAARIMEFAVETRTDVSHTYYKLAKYYSSRGMTDRISHLTQVAETLQSINRNAILKTLKESYL